MIRSERTSEKKFRDYIEARLYSIKTKDEIEPVIQPTDDNYNRIEQRLRHVIERLDAKKQMSEILKSSVYKFIFATEGERIVLELDVDRLLSDAIVRDVLYRDYQQKYTRDDTQALIYQKISSTSYALASLGVFLVEVVVKRSQTGNILDGVGKIDTPKKLLEVMKEFLEIERDSIKQIEFIEELDDIINNLKKVIEILNNPEQIRGIANYFDIRSNLNRSKFQIDLLNKIDINLEKRIRA
ncbi:MAG: hypothetical protein NZ908_00730 [Candidatus Micrarchaeota archaeon]|nr:hypothetical protein [Candidatus Micrarchaeota archaeon]MCX8154673.1 hypothetical protein [Candidatus Micrarchaeota archaeon]